MSGRSPKWFDHVRDIIATIGTGLYNPVQDKITHGVMSRVIPALMSRQGLDGKLLEAFVLNIRARGGDRSFQCAGPVVLTRNQRQHARDKGWDRIPGLDELRARADGERMEGGPEADQVLVDRELLEAYQQVIRFWSARDPLAIRSLSAFLTRGPAQKLEFWLLNEMKWKEMKHGLAMPAASPGMNASGVIGQVEEVIGQDTMPRAAALVHDHEPQAADAIEARHDGHQLDASQPGHEGERHGQGAGAARADAVTIWIKEDRTGRAQVSGYLDLGPDKYALRWSGWDHAIAKIEQPNPEWAAWAAREVAGTVIAGERGSAGLAARHTTSALYERGDRWARARPVSGNAAVVLEWEGDAPAQVVVIAGDQMTVAEVIRETNDRWKAVLK